MEAQATFSKAKLSAREQLPLHQVGGELPNTLQHTITPHFFHHYYFLLYFILFLHLQSVQCTQSFLTAVLWAVGSISAMLTYDFPFTLIPFVFVKVKREWPGKANAWLLPISPVCGHWEPVWCLKPITSTQSTNGKFECNGPVHHIGGRKVATLWWGCVERWKEEGWDRRAAVTYLK